ncbi:MAG: peptidase M3, partial [Rubrivivax sp.]|nr:peptidase M3 [Rubrivivax sp.]
MTPDKTYNPLLQDWDTPYGLPPFARLRAEHFEPALRAAMQEHLAELAAIAGSTEPPGFDDTVAAFDRAGRRLNRIATAFYTLTA